MNIALYLTTVLIWGTTWIAIKFQLGVVAAPVSIAYRFWIAALVLMLILLVRRQQILPPRSAWRYLLAQGLALFCCNFLCFYYATMWVPSGLVAVVFSTAPIWNAINGRLFMNRPIRPQVLGGAVLGLAGIVMLFLPSMQGHWNDSGMLAGLGLALLGTLCFSTGNLLSSRMQALGMQPWLTNTWAMLCGATILTLGALALGMPFNFDPSPRYVGALLYLAVPGSVVAFTAYLLLVGRIGPDRAAYCTVLFPVVALTVSTVFEGYQWSSMAPRHRRRRQPDLLLGEHQVPNAVAQFQATVFELGQRAVRRLRRVAFGGILQRWFGAQYFQHLHRVIFPVGGQVDIAARRQVLAQGFHERRLDQAALVVARLVPWVREIDMHARQRAGRDHVAQHFHRIVLDHAQVGQAFFADQLEQAAHARGMHFHADEVLLRHQLGDVGGGAAHAETDFQDHWRLAAKGLFEVQRFLLVLDHELRAEIAQRTLLRRGQASRARDEAADAVFGRVIEHFALWRGFGRHG
jgi:drug/metabolite transporter (DMT)-like permease